MELDDYDLDEEQKSMRIIDMNDTIEPIDPVGDSKLL